LALFELQAHRPNLFEKHRPENSIRNQRKGPIKIGFKTKILNFGHYSLLALYYLGNSKR